MSAGSAVSVSLPAGVTGYGLFRSSVAGRNDQEAVVPLSSAATTTSTLIWNDNNYVTAVAIVNPRSVPVTVSVTAWDSNGNQVGASSINLAANSKTAAALRFLPGLGGVVGKRGSAQFTVAIGNVAVLGLRFKQRGVYFDSDGGSVVFLQGLLLASAGGSPASLTLPTNTKMSSTIGPIAPSRVIGGGSGFRLLLREHLEPAQVEFAAA